MRELRESTAIPVPPERAESCILRYFEEHRGPGGSIEIPLRVDLAGLGVPGGMRLERAVSVRVRKQRDAQNLNDELVMEWDPGPGEPFPSFAGRLIVWSEGGPGTFVELRGRYEPPLGAPGRVFDQAVGRLIARHTAREFLRALSEGAQACCQR